MAMARRSRAAKAGSPVALGVERLARDVQRLRRLDDDDRRRRRVKTPEGRKLYARF
ncbi:MAG TPA: hypothetical protein VHT93_01260 [Pseudolabrys sp.]|nr:hypothetical protein [Pseudolabrys sp.]